ncbi:hypothetical protein DPMN_143533 [Dreissena polymorpha]|uniref:Uncharacterized protein n=1 Tax=Dreissena polymorpha TaxID=45954 RepID=A0A9D4JLS0_DREPO|nr:hypothetical protein DPMN_143533 [Dreissena polymorpha]
MTSGSYYPVVCPGFLVAFIATDHGGHIVNGDRTLDHNTLQQRPESPVTCKRERLQIKVICKCNGY